MAKLEVFGDLEVQDEIVLSDAAYIAGSTEGSGTLVLALTGSPSILMRCYGMIRSDSGFNVNGSDGIDTTFVDADGNTITVVGGIVTAKTAP
jgi:hypothetical protein